jgi:hypothetical protein
MASKRIMPAFHKGESDAFPFASKHAKRRLHQRIAPFASSAGHAGDTPIRPAPRGAIEE